jgi:hypothetical protein
MGLAAALCLMAVGTDATRRHDAQRSRREGDMHIIRNGSQPSSRGPSEYSTGDMGSTIEDIAPGDVVWIEPGEKHWHGTSPMTAMTHLAIVEMLDGTAVQWMEKVTDEQYGGDSSVREK